MPMMISEFRGSFYFFPAESVLNVGRVSARTLDGGIRWKPLRDNDTSLER